MKPDLVWIVGGPPDAPDRDELRYSIRSAVEHFKFDYRDVVIVGDVPDWFSGVKIPLPPRPGKWDNQRASIEAYVNYPGATDVFVLLNDDHYVLEPVAEVEPFHRGRASGWEQAHGTHDYGCYICAVKACANWVTETAGIDPLLHEAHTPLLFDTAKLRDLLHTYPTGRPFMIGAAFDLVGIGEGRNAGNAKVKGHNNLTAKLAQDMPYVSGNPDTWNGELGDLIRDRFPAVCEWEK